MIAPSPGKTDRSLVTSAMIEITIVEDLAAAGVAVALGCIECSVEVAREAVALGAALTEEAARRAEVLAGSPVGEVPQVAATRRAYKALGKDPSRYRPSAEALLRRLAQGKGLYRINTVVDTNNLVSLRTGLSIGAYDLAKLSPPVALRRGRAGESYEAIGRGPINLEGLPLLADRNGPFGSPTSDSARSMITEQTGRLLMVIFGFGAEPECTAALTFAAQCLESYCQASAVETAVVSNREAS
jgi:DNA/RNA-binding domain of Phe-tRNA-synthetase-like protein